MIFTAAPEADNSGLSLNLSSESQAIDIASLQNSQLFGPRDASVPNSEQNTARLLPSLDTTSLNLKLDGVIVANPPTQSMAMIVSNNGKGAYRIGDRLPAGNRVVVDQIFADRVILANNGRMETLWLYEQEASASSPARAGNSVFTNTLNTLLNNNQRTSAENSTNQDELILADNYDPQALVNEYQERFQGNALAADFLTFSEIVKISPEYNNGQLLGYRLSPGEHLKEFVRLGFKTNDIVTQLNGVELDNIANLPGLFETMTTARVINVSLLREGAPLALEVSLAGLTRN